MIPSLIWIYVKKNIFQPTIPILKFHVHIILFDLNRKSDADTGKIAAHTREGNVRVSFI